MFVRLKNNPFRTLRGRLTITYALLSGLLAFILLSILYFILLGGIKREIRSLVEFYLDDSIRIYQEYGLTALQQFLQDDSYGYETGYVQLLNPAGNILASSFIPNWSHHKDHHPIPSELSANKASITQIVINPPHKAWGMYKKINSREIFVIVIKLPGHSFFVRHFISISIGLTLFSILCGSGIGWIIASQTLSGVKKVSSTASQIGKGHLDNRVPIKNEPEEIKELASTFNVMLDRIAHLVRELKGVSNMVAHDLRSPLTRIRGNIEVALRGGKDIDTYEEVMQAVIGECGTLENMINTMLEIAELEAGIKAPKTELLDLKEILYDAEDLFSPLAESKNQNLIISLPQDKLTYPGDRSGFQRSLANVLDNAIKYSPENGSIHVTLKGTKEWIILTVWNSGPSILEKDLPHIFKPFYRGDKSRTQPGNGLGLSYVNAIIKQYNGIVSIHSPQKGGTEVIIKIPTTS